MSSTERAKAAALRVLLKMPGPCVTVAVTADEFGDIATGIKDAIRAIRQSLRDRTPEAETLLESVAAAGEIKTKPRGGIVILRSPSLLQVNRVDSIRPLARVTGHFDVRTLLSVMAAERLFYILALSQKRTRILKCTRDTPQEVPFPPGFPTSLTEAMETRPPDHTLDNRSSGGPSIGAGAVVFGTSSDRDDKDRYLLHFFRGIDNAVKALLADGEPLIAAGVEHEIALYRRVNTYTNLLEPGIGGAPDGIEAVEMHRRALDLLKHSEEKFGLPADFDYRVGIGVASTHIHEIVAASFEGRVSRLFFQASARYPGVYDPVRRRVKRTEDPLESPRDLIEAAALQTILRGGLARLLPPSGMPGGAAVCALFRYAEVQPAMGTEPVVAA